MVRKNATRRKSMRRGGYNYNKRNSTTNKRKSGKARKTQGGSDFLHLKDYYPYNMNVNPLPVSTTQGGKRSRRRKVRKVKGGNLLGNFSNFESGKAILGTGNLLGGAATYDILNGSPPTSSNPTYQPNLYM
jgi:hypothetical protein